MLIDFISKPIEYGILGACLGYNAGLLREYNAINEVRDFDGASRIEEIHRLAIPHFYAYLGGVSGVISGLEKSVLRYCPQYYRHLNAFATLSLVSLMAYAYAMSSTNR